MNLMRTHFHRFEEKRKVHATIRSCCNAYALLSPKLSTQFSRTKMQLSLEQRMRSERLRQLSNNNKRRFYQSKYQNARNVDRNLIFIRMFSPAIRSQLAKLSQRPF